MANKEIVINMDEETAELAISALNGLLFIVETRQFHALDGDSEGVRAVKVLADELKKSAGIN